MLVTIRLEKVEKMKKHTMGRYNGVNWKVQPICDLFPHLRIKTVYVFEYDENDKPTGDHFPTLKAFENYIDTKQEEN